MNADVTWEMVGVRFGMHDCDGAFPGGVIHVALRPVFACPDLAKQRSDDVAGCGDQGGPIEDHEIAGTRLFGLL